MIQQLQLQFYADKENTYTNKLFTFQVYNINDCFRILYRFAISSNHFRFASLNIRAEFMQQTNKIEVLRIQQNNLKSFCDYFNQCEFDGVPTLKECINDYRMWSE